MKPILSTLYVGTSEPSWISRTEVPLLIPYHRLLRRWGGKMPVSPWRGHWALDSGGYNHVREFGGWTLDPEVYVRHVRFFDETIGNLGWAAPMDWMCEADALAATGLTWREHQRRTVANYVELAAIWYRDTDDDCPIMPVLQGPPDAPEAELVRAYLECWDMYGEAGVNLGHSELVGLGSVCRQQATGKIGALVAALHEHDGRGEEYEPLPLHGFGCKTLGLVRYADLMVSADSQAWSMFARRNRFKWDGCPESHVDCRNCFHWAIEWHHRVLFKTGVYDTYLPSSRDALDWLERRRLAEPSLAV